MYHGYQMFAVEDGGWLVRKLSKAGFIRGKSKRLKIRLRYGSIFSCDRDSGSAEKFLKKGTWWVQLNFM
jgi:hypothetical protein